MNLEAIFGPVLHQYTRAQAIADGALVPMNEQVRQDAGLSCGVALTAAAHADVIAWGTERSQAQPEACQDETGRAWDVAFMLHHAMKTRGPIRYGDRIAFRVFRVPADSTSSEPEAADLVAVFGADENYRATVTIMHPDED